MDLINSESSLSLSVDLFNVSGTGVLNTGGVVAVRRQDAARMLSLLQWFIKCSAIEKINYLIRLANELTLHDFIEVIKPLKLYCCKEFIESEAAVNRTICLDNKVFNDDNVNLDKKTLRNTQDADFHWFSNLERVDQADVVIGLTKMLGIGNCRMFYKRLIRLYTCKVEKRDFVPEVQGVAEVADVQLPDSGNESSYDNVANTEEGMKVLELRKNWQQVIAKYRIQVFGKDEKNKFEKAGKKKDKKKAKGEKTTTSKTEKKDQSKTKIKSGNSQIKDKQTKVKRKPKKQKRDLDSQRLDQIQLLPIFISRKIFGYLDTITLLAILSVNSYWEYAVGQVLLERATRTSLDKLTNKLEEKIDINCVGATEQLTKATSVDFDCLDKRLNQLFERATKDPTMRQTVPPLEHKTLLQNVYEMAHYPNESFVLPTTNLRSFPRDLPHPPLHTYPTDCLTQFLATGPRPQRIISQDQIDDSERGPKIDAMATLRSVDSLPLIHASSFTTTDSSDGLSDIINDNDGFNDDNEELLDMTDMAIFGSSNMMDVNKLTMRSKSQQSRGSRAVSEGEFLPDVETLLKAMGTRISQYTSKRMP